MSSHLTSEQVTAKNNISDYLNDIDSSGTAVTKTVVYVGITSTRSIGRPPPPPTTAERIERASKRLQELGAKERLTEKEKKDIQFLYERLKKTELVLSRLSDEEALEVLNPQAATNAVKAQQAAIVLNNLKSQTEAAAEALRASTLPPAARAARAAQAAAGANLDKFEEQDLNDVEVVRATYQHYLLYNTEFFSQYHHEYLLQPGVEVLGYKPVDKNEEILQTVGYAKKKNPDQPRIFFLSDDTDSTIVNNKLSFCKGNQDFSRISTYDYAQLQPLPRIYKMYRNYKGEGRDVKVEFEFRNKTGLEGLESLVSVQSPVGGLIDQMYSRGYESSRGSRYVHG